MNFTITTSELLSKLQVSGGAIGSNPSMPILEDFLFTLEGDHLTVTASNLETTIVTKAEPSSSDSGQVTIPAKTLIDTLKALPDQPIKFAINDDNQAVEITSSFGKYKLIGRDPSEFPQIPNAEDADSFVIPAAVLKSAMSRTAFATSNDELRQAMMGVFFDISEGQVTFVATDAHKLVRYTVRGMDSKKAGSFIVPKKSLSLLNSALLNEGDVTVSYNNKNAFFEYGDTAVTCRLIDARYPDYNAVIPTDNPLELVVNRKDLLSSLKRLAIYANKTTNQVIFNIQEDGLTISSEDLDFSNEAKEQLVCSFNGDPLTMGFNAKFFIEMLNILGTEEVHFHLSEPNRAGILVPSNNSDEEELIMLVMPVMMGY